jgi:hypothetical protein
MRFANEGQTDRAARMVAGILLLSAGLGGFVTGATGLVVLGAGALLLATGILGWCPAYSALGLSTARAVDARCERCEGAHHAERSRSWQS